MHRRGGGRQPDNVHQVSIITMNPLASLEWIALPRRRPTATQCLPSTRYSRQCVHVVGTNTRTRRQKPYECQVPTSAKVACESKLCAPNNNYSSKYIRILGIAWPRQRLRTTRFAPCINYKIKILKSFVALGWFASRGGGRQQQFTS